MSTPHREDEYIWHFRLEEQGESPTESEEALTEMVRQQIAALLRCLQFMSDGRPVAITGFRFLADPAREHYIAQAPDDSAGRETD
jgi:hypothetical protein